MDEQKPVLVAKKEKKKKRKTFKVLPMTSGLKEKFGQLFKKAKLLECPNRLSGSARRRFANLDKKNTAEWTQDEKFFMEFAEFTRNARKKYFNKLKANNTNEVPQPSIKDENVQKASA